MKPHALLDHLVKELHLKSDAQLSERLDCAPPVLSKIRHGRMPLTSTFILLVHEKLGISVARIRSIAANEVNQEKSA